MFCNTSGIAPPSGRNPTGGKKASSGSITIPPNISYSTGSADADHGGRWPPFLLCILLLFYYYRANVHFRRSPSRILSMVRTLSNILSKVDRYLFLILVFIFLLPDPGSGRSFPFSGVRPLYPPSHSGREDRLPAGGGGQDLQQIVVVRSLFQEIVDAVVELPQ